MFVILGLLLGLGSGFYYLRLRKQQLEIKLQEGQMSQDIISLIEHGENDRVEFKSSLRYDQYTNGVNPQLEEVILKTIAGFLNANGGRLILGVNDEGEILGLKNDYLYLKKKDRDGLELKLFQMICNSIGPEFSSLIHVFFYRPDGKDVCVLNIDGSRTPAYVKNGKVTTFYLRVGNSTKPLTVKQAVNYISDEKHYAA